MRVDPTKPTRVVIRTGGQKTYPWHEAIAKPIDLALYTGALPIAGDVPWRHFTLAMFIAGLVLVPTVLYLDGRATKQFAPWPQYVLRTLAFAVWAMACSWPFSAWSRPDNARWVVAIGVLVIPFLGGLLLREKPSDSPTP